MIDSRKRIHEIEDRLQHFQTLMPHEVRNILLVASPYDSFLLKEDGQLHEIFLNEFLELNLRHVPGMRQVVTAQDALTEIRNRAYDLVITTTHLGDMPLPEFVDTLHRDHPRIPVVLLLFDERDLPMWKAKPTGIEQVFVWHGDFRILLAIVKFIEDRWNVADDVRTAGVSVILLIEDSVRYYSFFLPNFYAELFKQSERVVAEGVNLTHKVMRMRARPKILLCNSYEEAMAYYVEYRDHLLGVISDVDFPRNGVSDPNAGLDFARHVRAENPVLPIMLQTRDAGLDDRARDVGAELVLKGSPHLLGDLRRFMLVKFGFGDFVFRLPDGTEMARADTLRALEAALADVPEEVVRHHASLHDFSTWLRARTEFSLAERLRRLQVSDFRSIAEVREFLIDVIHDFRRERQAGVVTTYDRKAFDPRIGLSKIGTGSLGGKARGLAFVRELLYNHKVLSRYPGVRVLVPTAVVLATDVFDHFVDENGLREFALGAEDDAALDRAFLDAGLPKRALTDLYRFLETATYPLAVRSSSLLEDSQHHPFAGIYRTIMCPNTHPREKERRRDLVRAIKLVYASTFSVEAKSYMQSTTYRPEEEKMAVIVQRLGGARHGGRFYPHISGVARSHNFYPVPPMEARDGVMSLALGLGKTVVEGRNAIRICPRYPDRVLDYTSPSDQVENAQSGFYAVDLDPAFFTLEDPAEPHVRRYPLEAAIEDGTLAPVASVYSPDNDAVYDGLSRAGVPFVSMAPVLKHDVFPLAEIVHDLLEIGEKGLNLPVEIEFAVNLFPPPGEPREFYFLQMRPMVVNQETSHLDVRSFTSPNLLCRSRRVLGSGRTEGIRDIVVVDREHFDPAFSKEVARDVARMNGGLVDAAVPYVLIGTGRWGSSEPWLGIPVRWEQIAGARVIVEADFLGKRVAPSQGSHFFHNLTAALVGYFTVNGDEDGFVDWEWLRAQPAVEETRFARHVRLPAPLDVIVDGKTGEGVIVKPGNGGAAPRRAIPR